MEVLGGGAEGEWVLMDAGGGRAGGELRGVEMSGWGSRVVRKEGYMADRVVSRHMLEWMEVMGRVDLHYWQCRTALLVTDIPLRMRLLCACKRSRGTRSRTRFVRIKPRGFKTAFISTLGKSHIRKKLKNDASPDILVPLSSNPP